MLGMASVPLTELMLTMLPRPARAMSRATAWATRKAPLRLTRSTASKSASVMSKKSQALKIPALLTSTSMRPCALMAAATSASTWALSPTSQCTYKPPNSLARAVPRSSSMSAITTRAPSRAKRRQQASPMPCAPPVTRQTRPARPKEIRVLLSVLALMPAWYLPRQL